MKNKKLFMVLASCIILISLVLVGSLSAITGQIPFFDTNNNGSSDGLENDDGTNNGIGNYVDISINGSALKPLKLQYEVVSDYEGLLFFNSCSYGHYEKDGWNNHQEPFISSYNDLNPFYFTSEALKNSKTDVIHDIYTINITKYNPEDLNLTPYYLVDGPNNNNDFFVNFPYGKEYEVNFIPSKSVIERKLKLSDEHKKVEQAYYEYCKENYLDIPRSTRNVLVKFMDENHISRLQPEFIKYVQNVVLSFDTKKHKFNKADKSDLVIDLLNGNCEPTSINYASLASLIYRELGIPSRIAGGYVKDLKKDVATTIDYRDHICWTEIYVKNIGWIPMNVTPNLDKTSPDFPTLGLDNDSTVYNIKPRDINVRYDGSIHYATDEIQGLNIFEDKKYKTIAKVKGQRSELGISYTYIYEFNLYDASGNDVTSRYNFHFEPGILQIYQDTLIVKTDNLEKEYDGKYLISDVSTIYNKDIIEQNGHRIIDRKYQEPFKNVGRKINKVTLTILDEDDNDVTDIYYIQNDFGYLEITPRDIVISTHSSSKNYDGISLTNDGYDVYGIEDKNKGLVAGDKIKVITNGRQIDVGSSLNTISFITITDENGENAIHNYHINYKYGTLTVD